MKGVLVVVLQKKMSSMLWVWVEGSNGRDSNVTSLFI